MAAITTSADLQKALLESFDRVRKPWQHQEDVLRLAAGKKNFGLFMEVGTGKTFTCILLSRFQMHHRQRTMKTLILCPPIVVQNWKAEWLGASKFTDKQILCATGPGKKRADDIRNGFDKKVLITNYESLLNDDVMAALKGWGPEILVLDEAHRCKSPSAKRSKLAYELSRCVSVQHRYILTGTPVLQSPLDLFQQFLIMDLGATFGTNFFVFRNTYFVDKNAFMPPARHFPNWQIREGALEDITKRISDSSVSIKKSDCLTLPPLVKNTIRIQMTPEQKRIYSEISKDFIAFLNQKAVVAKTALTKGLRLMQIASGFASLEGDDNDDRIEHEIKDNPKDKALSELLEDVSASSKAIIWCAFRRNYRSVASVCEKLNLPYVQVHGGVSQKEKDEAVTSFNTDPKVKVIIGNAGSMGEGVNLTASNVSIFYSRTFSLGADIQAEARNFRGGSQIHDKVTRYDLVMEGTIEEHIAERLASKEEISETILKELVMG